jgi:1-pyrroline-4-hydroxy-2-carboxylate deaminase
MNWNGVMPAITTCFTADLHVDHGFVAKHCQWLLDNGCSGIVILGSLGEARPCRSTRSWRWCAPACRR